ncbi:Uncharacterised protein [uncultured archaeon]|nr:Uncharacterised protein [uncultured archaeon]
MLYCEACRVSKKLNRPSTFPYHNHYLAACEICGKNGDCYDFPALWARQRSTWTSEDILLDKRLQQEYMYKAESMILPVVGGSHAGAENPTKTAMLRNAFIKDRNTGDVDWYQTYELRKKIQEGFDKLNRR